MLYLRLWLPLERDVSTRGLPFNEAPWALMLVTGMHHM